MSIDKFGRSSLRYKNNLKNTGFGLTASGDLDVNHKRICNVYKPLELSDAANKFYTDEKINQNFNLLKTEIRLWVTHSNDILSKKINRKINEAAGKIKKIEDECSSINTKLSRSFSNPSVVVALPQSRKRPTSSTTNENPTNLKIKTTSTNMSIE